MPTAKSYAKNWYEAAMKSREDEFARRFGPTSPPDQVFKSQDENWETVIPGFGFLRYPPVQGRPFWLYVTHGISQPTDFGEFREGFEGGQSGFGLEYAMASRAEDGWPMNMLELLARYTVSSAKHILPFHRIPASDLMQDGAGGHLLGMSQPGYATEFRLLSGTMQVVHLVGITADETVKAKQYAGTVGSQILERALYRYGVGGVTVRERPSMIRQPTFAQVWSHCEAEVGGG